MTAEPASRVKIMGVVNVTPDSFSDGGQFVDAERAVAHALELEADGADVLDVGGESTRPGAAPVDAAAELARVLPVIERLAGRTQAALSIDTRKPAVARAAIAAGASIWNDVSALTFAPDSAAVAADLACDVILMHAQGDPSTMQNAPHYDDVVGEVRAFLAERLAVATSAGVAPSRLMVDPGIGFGKTLEHNLALLAAVGSFADLAPVLLGASRKRFIAALDREGPADARLGGSLAAALAGAREGVAMVRVHDVAATRQALAVDSAIRAAISTAIRGAGNGD
ncbi:MAG: dihydropteroate synthase [Pseudomonadota bacterium]